jgi:ABC-type Fe3+-hydroxamate transport system substrate-binding protein
VVFQVGEPAVDYERLAAVRPDAAAAVQGQTPDYPLASDGLPAVMAHEPPRPGGPVVVPPVYVVTPLGAVPSTP